MSETDASIDAAEQRYAATVGARLREVRRQKRLSLQAVEASSSEEFKASVLGAYERGERTISVPRLRRLAQLYDVPLDQLLPDGEETHSADGGGRIVLSTKIRIDLVRLKATPGPEAEALQRFLTKIQLERQDFNSQVLTVRADDLRVLGAILGLGVEDMVARLRGLGLLHAT